VNSLGALWYLDSRRALNLARTIVRTPIRLITWVFFGLWLGFTLWRRTKTMSGGALPDLGEPFATGFAGAILVFAGVLCAMAVRTGRVRGFVEPADALFLVRSQIPERLVATWIYGRSFILTFGLSVFFLAFMVAFYARSHVAGAILGIAGVLLSIEMLRIPLSCLARRAPWLAIVCYAIAAAGFLIILADVAPLLSPSFAPLQIRVVAFGLGSMLLALWHGAPAIVLGVYLFALAALAIGCALAVDIYPDLYTSGVFAARVRSRMRRGIPEIGTAYAGKPARSGTTRLSGPWVEIWKQLIFFRRGRGPTFTAILFGLGIVCGLVAGIAGWSNPANCVVLFSTVMLIVAVFLSTWSISLGSDLSKPIWWMGSGSTFSKLAAWTIGSTIPAIVPLVLAALIGGAIGNRAALLPMAVAACVIPLVMRGIGALTYSFLPNKGDQRGIVAILRMVIVYAVAIPAGVIGIAVGIVVRSATVGGVTAILVCGLEGALALAIGAWRIGGRGVEFALAEST